MGAPCLGYCAFSDISFLRCPSVPAPTLVRAFHESVMDDTKCSTYRVRFFLHHGAGASRTEGGKLNRLIAFMERFDADVYFSAHCHDQVAKRVAILTASPDCTKLQEKSRLGIITGTYLRTYHQGSCTYGEVKGYLPVPLGARYVKVKPEERYILGEV